MTTLDEALAMFTLVYGENHGGGCYMWESGHHVYIEVPDGNHRISELFGLWGAYPIDDGVDTVFIFGVHWRCYTLPRYSFK